MPGPPPRQRIRIKTEDDDDNEDEHDFTMERTIKAELLDELPADDPCAMGSRRDIHRLNFLMGNLGTLLGLMHTARLPQPRRLVELGAGDGRFMLRLARYLSRRWKSVEVLLVDRKNVVTTETRGGFAALGWSVDVVTADVFDWLRESSPHSVDAIVANLFLHHFPAPQLSELLRLAAARTRMFAACEPWRSRTALAFSRTLRFIGCNAVTCHDAVASVRAGFAGRELSALWPKDNHWQLRERSARLFTHAFVAEHVGERPYA